MRKITQQAVSAFYVGHEFHKNNTTVVAEAITSGRYMIMYLHGNAIARLNPQGELEIRTCGWGSSTTKERLNGLKDVQVYHHKHELYLNGKKWMNDRDWTSIG